MPRRSGCEFRHVECTEIDSACRIQPQQQRGSLVGLDVAEDLAATGGDPALSVQQILMSERHAVKRATGLSGCKLSVAFGGRTKRRLFFEKDEGIHFRLPGLDSVEAGLRRLDRTDAAGSNRVRDFRQIEERWIAHRAAPSRARAKWAGSSSNRSVPLSRRTAALSRPTSAASSAARALLTEPFCNSVPISSITSESTASVCFS